LRPFAAQENSLLEDEATICALGQAAAA